jgi:hypothetical protein
LLLALLVLALLVSALLLSALSLFKMNCSSYAHICCDPAVVRGKHCSCDFVGTPADGCICLFESEISSTCSICYEVCTEFYTLCNVISSRAATQHQTPSAYVALNREYDATVRRAIIVNKFLLNVHTLAGSEFVEPTKEEREQRIMTESDVPQIMSHHPFDYSDDEEEYATRFPLTEQDQDDHQDYYDEDELDRAFEIQYNEHLRQLAAKHLLNTPPTVDVLTLDTSLPFEPEYYFDCMDDTYA